MITLSITEANVFKALGDFLVSVLPVGVTVVRGQQNRVAQPASVDHVVMWPLNKLRLSQNVDEYSDIAFIGSITGTTLSVSSVLEGVIAAGLYLSAENIAVDTHITAILTGTGGVGDYRITPTQNLASRPMQAGSKDHMQATQITIQVDVHGPSASDNAQRISTLLRDEYGTESFRNSGFNIAPLYSNDPRQIPFTNAEQQIEAKWSVEVVLQANPVVSIPQQFADVVEVALISADRTYS